jgi:hypothetical protein
MAWPILVKKMGGGVLARVPQPPHRIAAAAPGAPGRGYFFGSSQVPRSFLNEICVGGLFPGNDTDQEPVYAPLDLDRTIGNTCSFDIDCGITNRCYKSAGSITGICVSPH